MCMRIPLLLRAWLQAITMASIQANCYLKPIVVTPVCWDVDLVNDILAGLLQC
jgi:hypothetical protein